MKTTILAFCGLMMCSTAAYAQTPATEITLIGGFMCESKAYLDEAVAIAREQGIKEQNDVATKINTQKGKNVCQVMLVPTVFEVAVKKIGSISKDGQTFEEDEVTLYAIVIPMFPANARIKLKPAQKFYMIKSTLEELEQKGAKI